MPYDVLKKNINKTFICALSELKVNVKKINFEEKTLQSTSNLSFKIQILTLVDSM